MRASEESPERAVPFLSGQERRTGVVFLCLIVATNFVPWMQLAGRVLDPSMPDPASESVAVIASCLLAGMVVIAGWFLGRRLPAGRGPRIPEPRDVGLALAAGVSALNLILAGLLHRIAADPAALTAAWKWFPIVWYGLAVPLQAAAAFCKGRASNPSASYRPLLRSPNSS